MRRCHLQHPGVTRQTPRPARLSRAHLRHLFAAFNACHQLTSRLPTPPALTPTSTTTTLNIFGPPPAVLPDLQPYLASIGDILSYTAGPEGSNWWTVTYASPTSAAYCLRRHGELIQGRWILGVTIASSATSGASPLASGSGFGNINGASAGPNNSGRWEIAQPPRSAEMLSDHSGAGTPLRPREGNALRSKTPVQVKKEDYAWEEQQSESGVMGKVADWLVSLDQNCVWSDLTGSLGGSRVLPFHDDERDA